MPPEGGLYYYQCWGLTHIVSACTMHCGLSEFRNRGSYEHIYAREEFRRQSHCSGSSRVLGLSTSYDLALRAALDIFMTNGENMHVNRLNCLLELMSDAGCDGLVNRRTLYISGLLEWTYYY